MDQPYIKLLLLLVPAIMTAVVLVLSPIYEAKKLKSNLLGKTITVWIYMQDEDGEQIELYQTQGVIETINEDVMEIKRTTQPPFRLPYPPMQLSKKSEPSFESDYIAMHWVDTEKDLDRNRGITASNSMHS